MEELLGAKNLHVDGSVEGSSAASCESAEIDPKGIYKKYYQQPVVDLKKIILSIHDMPCRNPVKNR